jgi:hypothetical protein
LPERGQKKQQKCGEAIDEQDLKTNGITPKPCLTVCFQQVRKHRRKNGYKWDQSILWPYAGI